MVFFKKLKIVLLGAVLAMVGQTACAANGDKAGYPESVVYHVNDSAVAGAAMKNIKIHMATNPQVKIVLVTHGNGIDFLLEGAVDDKGNPYSTRVQELTAKGVTFDVCEKTLVTRNIDPKKVLMEAVIVPSGVAEVARLQSQEHFVYFKP